MSKDAEQIISVTDLIQKIGVGRCGDIGHSYRPLFYRGHANKDWTLLPSVMRDPLFHERSLILDYKQVFDVVPDYLENMERILSTMQHHSIPTRLLDWSVSPLQTLYFACANENEIKKDGELISINPWSIHCAEFSRPGKPTYHFELMKRARFCLALGWTIEEISAYMLRQYGYRIQTEELSEPLPIVGRYLDKRVANQQGMFLLWGVDKLALDFQPSYRNQIKRFRIPSDKKPIILSELSMLGVTDFTTFRDAEGFKKAVDTTGSIFMIK